jgi:HEAT repeat protein
LNAVGALAGIGPDVDGVLPAIAVATIDLDSNVVVAATSALGEFGAAGLPALQEALRDPAMVTRSHAAWSLLRMGPAAQPAVPQLIKLLADPEGQTCQAAVSALEAIGPGAREAVPALMGLLSDRDLRHDVQKALDEILKGYKER